jgi:hypothetical protein
MAGIRGSRIARDAISGTLTMTLEQPWPILTRAVNQLRRLGKPKG